MVFRVCNSPVCIRSIESAKHNTLLSQRIRIMIKILHLRTVSFKLKKPGDENSLHRPMKLLIGLSPINQFKEFPFRSQQNMILSVVGQVL